MKILTLLLKLPKNVGNLGNIIAATGFEKLLKVQEIAQSGHTVSLSLSHTIPHVYGCGIGNDMAATNSYVAVGCKYSLVSEFPLSLSLSLCHALSLSFTSHSFWHTISLLFSKSFYDLNLLFIVL